MRRCLLIFWLINLIIVGLILNSVFTLITLLFEDCSADAILAEDVPALGIDISDKVPQYIPRIIHQTWTNDSIPLKWQKAQKSCMDLHKDYEYKLWTNEKARDFIATEYSWFLPTFENYPYPIMRADAIRYFVLTHYGGIYIDLDDGCKRKLDPLLSYHAWLRKTVPSGISNDAMGSVPKHPFFLKVIDSLKQYNRNWQVPYITVMYNTGPLFLSVIWKQYMRTVTSEDTRVRILMPDEYNKKPWSFFGVYKGSSWHRTDAKTIFWMGQHWIIVTVIVVFVIFILYGSGFYIYRWLHLRNSSPQSPFGSWSFFRRQGYKRLVKHEV